MPLISVILPVYNGEKTILETINSILNQTFSDFELIIINDGSTDSTLDIISNLQDHRIKIFSYPNAGLSASRNRGITQASSEYITFIDADDLWTEDKLESQFKALQEHPDAFVVYSWTNYIDELSHFIRRGAYMRCQGDIHAHLLISNCLESGSNPLIRREALEKVGDFDESVNSAADWDMYIRLSQSYHFVVVPIPQILYRLSANSMSTNVLRQESETLLVIEKAFSEAPQSLQVLKKISLANIYKYLAFKALEGSVNRKNCLIAARFFKNALKYDPSLLSKRVTAKILLKLLIILLLPPQYAQQALTRYSKALDTSTILGYMKTQPF